MLGTEASTAMKRSAEEVFRFRYLGLVGLIGWAVFVVASAAHPPVSPRDDQVAQFVMSDIWVPLHAVGWAGLMLGLLGLFAIYARQSDRAGLLGSVGFVLTFFGLAMFSGILFIEFTVQPSLAVQAPELVAFGVVPRWPGMAAGLLILAGGLMLGISFVRAKVLPSGAGYLLIVSTLAVVIAQLGSQAGAPFRAALVALMLFGISLAWLSYSAWSMKSPSASTRGGT